MKDTTGADQSTSAPTGLVYRFLATMLMFGLFVVVWLVVFGL